MHSVKGSETRAWEERDWGKLFKVTFAVSYIRVHIGSASSPHLSRAPPVSPVGEREEGERAAAVTASRAAAVEQQAERIDARWRRRSAEAPPA